MTNQSALTYAKLQLKGFSESYNIDAQLFIMHILGISKIDLLTKDFALNDLQIDTLNGFITRRKKNEPVAYILNSVEFMSMDFYVDNNTLIPRPDTEILVEKVLDISRSNSYMNFLEIGIGSGCISISLAKFSNMTGAGVDIMDKCVEISNFNAKKNNVHDKLEFKKSNLFDKIDNKYDIIISNPPYINKDDMELLLPNVKEYEPYSALFGGDNGLYFYENIIKTAKNYLKPNGMLAFEIGYDQKESVTNLMKSQGFNNITSYKDLYQLDRVVIGFV